MRQSTSLFPVSTMRHSAAHVMAAAIQKLWPNARFGVGPDIKNGFYYDFALDEKSFTEEDVAKIQDEMKKIVMAKQPFLRFTKPIDEAISLMREQGQTFKVELLTLLKEKGSTAVSAGLDEEIASEGVTSSGVEEVSFYQLGDFVDLCRGPHVNHSGQIGAFQLNTNIAGAYWRGDEANPMLTRVYGLCFETQQALKEEIARQEEAKKRDHRNLAKKLKIYTIEPNDIGAGLPIWLPNGTTICRELEKLAEEEERKDGYQRVSTSPLAKEAVFERSGHLPYYANDMYSAMDIDGDKFRLAPMNCPRHHYAFKAEPRSHRDMPVRIAEFGSVFRYEKHGALNGIMRTRGFTQNDGHIYCRYDQAIEEFVKVMRLHERLYHYFGITDYYLRFSLPDNSKSKQKYVDNPEAWQKACEIIREAAKIANFKVKEVPGEAAFYGPKIDFMITSAIGIEYAISTNQVDFLASEKFDLTYTGQDGKKHPVYVLHRAPLGSYERFVAFLVEHYAAEFPTWLAPVQAKILPVSEKEEIIEYAERVYQRLFNERVHNGTHGLRVEIDAGDTLNKRIRNAKLDKIPYTLVLGEMELQNNTVTVRLRNGENIKNIPLDTFISHLKSEAEDRVDLIDQLKALNNQTAQQPQPRLEKPKSPVQRRPAQTTHEVQPAENVLNFPAKAEVARESQLMFSKKLFWHDTYLSYHETQVIEMGEDATKGHWVRLRETIFHPQGGGQPSDEGTINGFNVIKLEESKDRTNDMAYDEAVITHYLESQPDFKEGETVKLSINLDKRLHHAALHTAGHVAAGVLRTRYGYKQQVTANHFPNQAKIEFKKDGNDVEEAELVTQVQTVIDENKAVSEGYGDVPEAHKRPGAGASQARLITIAGLWTEPCSGTHVSTTGEIKHYASRGVSAKKGKLTVKYDAESTQSQQEDSVSARFSKVM